ncbi:MAG TPA: hypothetical protein PKE38_08990 [Ignavibacteriaceae bacterium]|nr:hypothetical protein [Ignavibacteriaceae bacterium]
MHKAIYKTQIDTDLNSIFFCLKNLSVLDILDQHREDRNDIAGENSIRDVIAFPKTASAISLMDDSPPLVDENQLKELHIKIR